MNLKRAYFGNPILRQKALLVTEINDEIKKLVEDMIDNIHTPPLGSGLAAPQVHKSIRLFIVQFYDQTDPEHWKPGPIEVFINPKILSVSDDLWVYQEGCLSLPGVYGDVPRPKKITIEYTRLDGTIVTKEYSEYDARQILHENDHLNGVLFIDRIHPKERKAIENDLRKIKNKYKV